MGNTDMCHCETEAMTAKYILQECDMHQTARNPIWPEIVQCTKKFIKTISSEMLTTSSKPAQILESTDAIV